MSEILRSLINKECIISDYNGIEYNCVVNDVDDEWIRITEHLKKSDVEKILKIDIVESFVIKESTI